MERLAMKGSTRNRAFDDVRGGSWFTGGGPGALGAKQLQHLGLGHE